MKYYAVLLYHVNVNILPNVCLTGTIKPFLYIPLHNSKPVHIKYQLGEVEPWIYIEIPMSRAVQPEASVLGG